MSGHSLPHDFVAAARDAIVSTPEMAEAVFEIAADQRDEARAREIRAAVNEVPAEWFAERIETGGILEAASLAAIFAGAYYRVGRPQQAAAELLAFLETLAVTLATRTRELLAEDAAAAHRCPWDARRRGAAP